MVRGEWSKPHPQMRPMHVLPQRKCCYQPWFKSYHKWKCTVCGWLSYLPWGYICEWTNHAEGIFRIYPFFAKKLRWLPTPAECIRKCAKACVIPIILYCSPAIFLGLLKQDFALLRRSIKFISKVCCLSFSYITNLVCERHIKSSSNFAAPILADNEHPLHEELSKAKSHTSTTSRFMLLPSKTAAYRNPVFPALSRLLVDRNTELGYYLQELSWSISSSPLFPIFLIVPLL